MPCLLRNGEGAGKDTTSDQPSPGTSATRTTSALRDDGQLERSVTTERKS